GVAAAEERRSFRREQAPAPQVVGPHQESSPFAAQYDQGFRRLVVDAYLQKRFLEQFFRARGGTRRYARGFRVNREHQPIPALAFQPGSGNARLDVRLELELNANHVAPQ